MTKKGNILVIMLGGTIDSEPYDKTPNDVKVLEHTIIPDAVRYLLKTEKAKDCDFYEWIREDSKEFFKKEDSKIKLRDGNMPLEVLKDIILNANYENIVVIFGTDRTAKLAKFLDKELRDSEKKVVITGAMEPLTSKERSDGFNNLEVAIDKIDKLDRGVYVVAHEKIFLPKGLNKIKEEKKFVGRTIEI